MKWIANLTGGYTSSAKVVDGALVLSLPDAIAPVVWRMELGQVKSSALEVREKDDGTFMLTLKTPKGDVNEIAPFDERAKAIRALMAVSHAMEQGHGYIPAKAIANDDSVKPAAAGTAPPHAVNAQPARNSNAAASLIGVVILVAMIAGLIMLGPRGAGGPGDPRLSGASGTAGDAAARTTGVPVSADDFLRNR